jgi:rare lipoprotein A
MTPVSRWPAIVSLLVVLLMAGPALAGFQLVLKNGKVLNGADLARENGNYVLIQANGQRTTLAPNQVAEVRILGDDVVAAEGSGDAPGDDAEQDEPVGQNLAGGDVQDRVIRAEPSSLAGGEAPELPQTQDGAQNLAGGTDQPLQPGEWRPESDWAREDEDDWSRTGGWESNAPDRTWIPDSDYATDLEDNNWNPSTWTLPAIDPKGTPVSDLDTGLEKNDWNPSTWTKPASQPSWQPTDGFNRTNSSMRVNIPPAVAGTAPAVDAGKSPGGFTTMEGPASWYGEAFRGRTTASGKPFDPDGLTAAHDTLPFGTLVLVTRQGQAGRSVVGEINDRGAGSRLGNLSQGAAAALDMMESGVVEVRVEAVPDQVEQEVPAMAKGATAPEGVEGEPVADASEETADPDGSVETETPDSGDQEHR